MRITHLEPEYPVHGTFRVDSPSGRSYHVEVRGVAPGESVCECVDFRSNGLGTCKHVEAVLGRLRRREGRAWREACGKGSPRPELIVDRDAGGLRLAGSGR